MNNVRRNRLQFSLSVLFIFVAVAGALLGMASAEYHASVRRKSVIRKLQSIGGRRLEHHKETVSVFLGNTSADDKVIVEVADVFPRCEKLYLSNTMVTDQGIVSLSQCRHLHVLWIDGTKVTSSSIDVIGRFEALCELRVDDRMSAMNKVDELRRRRPDLTIEVVECP